MAKSRAERQATLAAHREKFKPKVSKSQSTSSGYKPRSTSLPPRTTTSSSSRGSAASNNVSDLNLSQLQKLAGFKQQYASGDEAQKAEASRQADALRSSAGITSGSAGQYSLDELNRIISGRSRVVEEPTLPVDNTEVLRQKLLDERQKAALGGLRKSFEAGKSALAGEQATIEPAFAGARSNVRAISARGAQGFSDFLAQRGITRAGGAALGEEKRLGREQAGIGALEEQRLTAVGDIARRRGGLEAGYASDVEATKAGLQAEQLQAELTRQSTAESARAAADQQAFENAIKAAGITGEFGGAPTLAGGKQAFQQQIDIADFNEKIRQFDATLDQTTREFEANNALDIRTQSANEIQDRIDSGIRAGQLSVSEGNLLLQKKRFEADNDPDSLDNILKQQKIDAVTTTATATDLARTPQAIQDESEQFIKEISSESLDKQAIMNYLSTLQEQGISMDVIQYIAAINKLEIIEE